MSRQGALIYIIGGLAVAGLGFIISGPSVANFWQWLTLPGIMVVGGIIGFVRHL